MLNRFGKYLIGISLGGLVSWKITQQFSEKQKKYKYGCCGKPKKYFSYTPKKERVAGITSKT